MGKKSKSFSVEGSWNMRLGSQKQPDFFHMMECIFSREKQKHNNNKNQIKPIPMCVKDTVPHLCDKWFPLFRKPRHVSSLSLIYFDYIPCPFV
jgi:hypothetical protein